MKDGVSTHVVRWQWPVALGSAVVAGTAMTRTDRSEDVQLPLMTALFAPNNNLFFFSLGVELI